MSFPDIFTKEVTGQIVSRIENLRPDTAPQWGKMTVAQMLAHCSVTYEMIFTDKHPKPGSVKRWLLKAFVKDTVVGAKPYKRNSPTAPAFKIEDERDFASEQRRLIDYLWRTQSLGAAAFQGRESNSFGALSTDEWNTMFYKHLDHHLTQFGV